MVLYLGDTQCPFLTVQLISVMNVSPCSVNRTRQLKPNCCLRCIVSNSFICNFVSRKTSRTYQYTTTNIKYFSHRHALRLLKASRLLGNWLLVIMPCRNSRKRTVGSVIPRSAGLRWKLCAVSGTASRVAATETRWASCVCCCRVCCFWMISFFFASFFPFQIISFCLKQFHIFS